MREEQYDDVGIDVIGCKDGNRLMVTFLIDLVVADVAMIAATVDEPAITISVMSMHQA